jgi:hypothetical protein
MLAGVGRADVSVAPASGHASVGISSDEYDVYEVVLRQHVDQLKNLEREHKTKGLVLVRQTDGGGLEKHPASESCADKDPESVARCKAMQRLSSESRIDKEFLAAYREAVQSTISRIEPRKLRLPAGVRLGEPLNGPPKQISLAFSRVGFDAEHYRAVVFVDMYCGALCGGGGIIELERLGRTWNIVRHIGTWAS